MKTDGPAATAGAAVIGHCFPIWLKFKGGKGVATYFGTLLAFWWVAFLAAAASWLLPTQGPPGSAGSHTQDSMTPPPRMELLQFGGPQNWMSLDIPHQWHDTAGAGPTQDRAIDYTYTYLSSPDGDRTDDESMLICEAPFEYFENLDMDGDTDTDVASENQ